MFQTPGTGGDFLVPLAKFLVFFLIPGWTNVIDRQISSLVQDPPNFTQSVLRSADFGDESNPIFFGCI